ncbi:ribonuclease HIII [Streptococcus sp. DD13]|uniref:ribonuclease HIII n=1 Tax=Streptococcus sp. DD13 TaxID=1777881 RepID=UPI00082BDB63|nr:ribonuclease HIII [Streptococcus sp. DD13]
MSTVVIKASASQVEQIIRYYQKDQVQHSQPYMLGFFKKPGASISVYQSGKVMFQGERAEEEASKWGHQTSKPEHTGQDFPMIGTDEVGNGSYFGGLYVVASYVEPKDHPFLSSLGVDDSKKLTDQTIRTIAPLLRERIPHQALPVSPKKYNQAIAQGYNAVSIKVALHNQAIHLLLQQGVHPDKIVIDAFTSPRNYQKYVQKERHPVSQPISLEEKAESKYLAVAVSSIIARDLFLQYLEEISQQLGQRIPSGAGHASDLVAADLLKQYGMVALEETAKLHFANTEKAKNIANRGS